MQLDIKTSCIAIAADVASVNLGKKTGVLTRLETTMPWLINMHCVTHRLEVAPGNKMGGPPKESHNCLDQRLPVPCVAIPRNGIRVTHGYPCCRSSQDEGGYVKLMTSHHFVLYLASYQDLVDDLAELSLALQDETMPISSV